MVIENTPPSANANNLGSYKESKGKNNRFLMLLTKKTYMFAFSEKKNILRISTLISTGAVCKM